MKNKFKNLNLKERFDIRDNFKIKILSLFLAIIAWSYVVAKVNPDMTKEFRGINVSYKNLDKLLKENKVLVSPKSAKIDITLRGKRNSINAIKNSDIKAEVNLLDYNENNNKLNIKIEGVPTDVRILEFQRNLIVEVEKIIEKEFEVNVVTKNKLPSENLVVATKEASPKKIKLKGATSKINNVKSLVAEVDLSDIKNDSIKSYELKIMDTDGNQMDSSDFELSEKSVAVTINLLATKEVKINKNITGKPQEGYDIEISDPVPSTVVITGKHEDLEKVNSIDTKSVDISNINQSKVIKLELLPGENYSLLNPNIDISLNIKVEKIISKEFSVDLSNFTNISSEFKDKLKIQSFNIKLKGKQIIIDALNKNDIKLKLLSFNPDTKEQNVGILSDMKDILIESPEEIKIELIN